MTDLFHRTLFLEGPAGRLEALLWAIEQRHGRETPLVAVVCHPHPLFGGTMHNKVVYQTAKTLHGLGVPVLRFNFRGVGLSAGTHDNGEGERDDVVSAVDFLTAQYPGTPLLLAGFSFGAWVGLRVGCSDRRVTELICMGLPVGGTNAREFVDLDSCAKPALLVSGEYDEYGPPEQLKTVVDRFSAGTIQKARVAIIPQANHFFAGHLPELQETIVEWLGARHPELNANIEPSQQ